MKYAIIANPSSGGMTSERRIFLLETAAGILKAPVFGLDTRSAEDFICCARDISRYCDILVVAGGDGTFSAVINAVDLNHTTLACLPMGSGNALKYALEYPFSFTDTIHSIKNGQIHRCDLIQWENAKYAMFLSAGIEGTVVRCREDMLKTNQIGFKAYLLALLKSMAVFRPYSVNAVLDGDSREFDNVLSVIVSKHPYYGYGMKVIPRARLNDGLLHILFVRAGALSIVSGLVTSFTVGNLTGSYYTANVFTMTASRPVFTQFDGNCGMETDRIGCKVLPGALRIISMPFP